MNLDDVEQTWNVLRLVVTDDSGIWEVTERADIGTLVLSSDEVADDQSVINALLDADMITEDEDLNVDGDDSVLQITDVSEGRPRFTLVRDRRS